MTWVQNLKQRTRSQIDARLPRMSGLSWALG
jgi:hypothetical protein